MSEFHQSDHQIGHESTIDRQGNREGSDYRTEPIDKNNMNSIAQLDNGSWKTIDVGVNGGANSRQPVNNKAMNRYMSSLDHEIDDAYALN